VKWSGPFHDCQHNGPHASGPSPRPGSGYTTSVTGSLRSGIDDVGQRAETFVACHLLKAVEGWTDLGLGSFELRYLRDKLKCEVDFLVVRDRKPWFLVEVKTSDTRLSDSLTRFKHEPQGKTCFRAVIDLPFVAVDCFSRTDPVVVPARTLLSQLL
jgi:uncharacterized protein